ncbi:MAG: Arabinose 5-phosphate isomerase KdsD [Chlamydiia bacterium]|nr:Arabinose 5-phosphate isomerase KdsD [Chlamydiia bacterium]MCH9629882.1 Arabinose 5-phosphate isomerase KdsD [Chlamydiia bacterium]
MLKDLFAKQQAYINAFFDRLNLEDALRMIEAINGISGALIFTGVGKSGHISEKLAATYTSLGIRSHHLRPLDALHGDIGIVGEGDLVILLSKSGASEELLRLVPAIKERGAKTLAWTSTQNSRLSQIVDDSIVLPLEKELCKFDLAPTTSPAIQLIFGDVLAVHLMEKRKLTLDAYQSNHPAGAIGKKISEKVEDIMVTGADLPLVTPETKLVDALHILTEKRKGCVLVVNEDKQVLGIFTDGDLRRALQKDHAQALGETMSDLMTDTFIAVTPKMRAIEALKLMQKKRKVMMAPVVEGGQLKGLIHLHDILQG